MKGLVDVTDAGTSLVAARRPELVEATASHYGDLAAIAGVELVELCRARVKALVAGTAPPLSAGGAQTDVARACLALTDQFFVSAQSVSDAEIDPVSHHLEPGQVFALVVAISLAERWYRLTGFLAGSLGTR
jgi:alkylhydroperoxidase family enzyme